MGTSVYSLSTAGQLCRHPAMLGTQDCPCCCPALGHLVKIIPSLCFSLASQPVLHPPSAVPARGVRLQEQPLHPGTLEMRWGQRLPGQQ